MVDAKKKAAPAGSEQEQTGECLCDKGAPGEQGMVDPECSFKTDFESAEDLDVLLEETQESMLEMYRLGMLPGKPHRRPSLWMLNKNGAKEGGNYA